MRDPLVLILVIVLIFAVVGTIPTWSYSRSWGYWPGGILGIFLVVLLLLIMLGRL